MDQDHQLAEVTATSAGYQNATNAIVSSTYNLPTDAPAAAHAIGSTIPILPTDALAALHSEISQLWNAMTLLVPALSSSAAPLAVAPPHPQFTYCWTHGSGNNPDHDSHTCRNCAVGHIESVTFRNKQGGSTKHAGSRTGTTVHAPGPAIPAPSV